MGGQADHDRGEGDRLQRGDVSGVADGDPEPGPSDPVPGDHGAGCGGDIDDVGAEPLLDDHFRGGQLRWDGVAIAAPVDQCLPVAVRSSDTITENTVGGSGRRR